MVFATTQEAVANSVYLWVYVLIGVIALFGTGGFAALVVWFKRQGVRDAQLDEAVRVVLGDPKADIGSPEWLGLKGVVANIDRATRRNGLTTNDVGDVAGRIELKLDRHAQTLSEHMGESREQHRAMWLAINRKADKVTS